MIYVECNTEETLVRHVTGLPRRGIRHEGGKSRVCNRLSLERESKGVVDEDPGSPQPPYLARIDLHHELHEDALLIYRDTARGNTVVALRPRLEEWVLAGASQAGIRVGELGFPSRAASLKRVIGPEG